MIAMRFGQVLTLLFSVMREYRLCLHQQVKLEVDRRLGRSDRRYVGNYSGRIADQRKVALKDLLRLVRPLDH